MKALLRKDARGSRNRLLELAADCTEIVLGKGCLLVGLRVETHLPRRDRCVSTVCSPEPAPYASTPAIETFIGWGHPVTRRRTALRVGAVSDYDGSQAGHCSHLLGFPGCGCSHCRPADASGRLC
jgi:hypothetical protein